MKNSKIKNMLLRNYLFSYIIIIPSFFASIIIILLTTKIIREDTYKILGLFEVNIGSVFLTIVIITFLINGFILFFYAKYTSNKFILPIEHIVHVINTFNNDDKTIRMKNTTNNEFSIITTTFNNMADKIQESELKKDQLLEDKRQLMGDIVHDLKTPISSIKGYSEILINDDLDENQKINYLNIIYKSSLRLNELIEDLNQYSNLNINEKIYSKEKRDIVSWFRELVIEYYDIFITNKFILDIEIPDISVNFQFDPRLLKRAIFNIFENIIKYNPPNTNVKIKFSVSDDNIVINIKDDGIGISPEYKTKIFQPFFSIDKSRNSKSKGSGLGLAITSKIIKHHKGKIFLEDTNTKGTSFIIILPL